MTLWIGNGAVLKSSSQWQLKEFRKLNSSGHEFFFFFFFFFKIDKILGLSNLKVFADDKVDILILSLIG